MLYSIQKRYISHKWFTSEANSIITVSWMDRIVSQQTGHSQNVQRRLPFALLQQNFGPITYCMAKPTRFSVISSGGL